MGSPPPGEIWNEKKGKNLKSLGLQNGPKCPKILPKSIPNASTQFIPKDYPSGYLTLWV